MTRLAAALALLVLAGACGQLDTAGVRGGDGVQQGGSLKVGLPTEPRTLDPLYASTADELEVMRQMYDPLLELDAQGHLGPGLATSWDFPDPLTLLLNLRRGVRFQDGSAFDSEAVRFSLERELGAAGSAQADELAAVRSVATSGDAQVLIRLRRPDAALPYALTGPAGMVVAPDQVRRAGAEYEFGRNPVVAGTGPFEFVFWRRGYHIILKRFSGCWAGDPHLDQLDFSQSDPGPALDRLRSGDLDVLRDLPRAAVAAVRQDPGLQLSWRPGFAWSGLELNSASGVFADAAHRRALAAAVHPAALVQTVLGGVDTPAPESAGSSAPAPGPAFAFTLKVDTGDQDLAEAEAIRAQAAAAQITVNVQPEDQDTLQQELRGRAFEAALTTTGGSPDPDLDLYSQFHSGGALNYGGFSDPAVDRDLELARTVPDGPGREAFYADARRRLAQAAAFVFISAPPVFLVAVETVHGLAFHADGTHDLTGTWLD